METLGELLIESGISYAHIAKRAGITTQSVYQYKNHPAQIKTTANGAYIKIFKDVSGEVFYNECGRVITKVKYMWVREFNL